MKNVYIVIGGKSSHEPYIDLSLPSNRFLNPSKVEQMCIQNHYSYTVWARIDTDDDEKFGNTLVQLAKTSAEDDSVSNRSFILESN